MEKIRILLVDLSRNPRRSQEIKIGLEELVEGIEVLVAHGITAAERILARVDNVTAIVTNDVKPGEVTSNWVCLWKTYYRAPFVFCARAPEDRHTLQETGGRRAQDRDCAPHDLPQTLHDLLQTAAP